MRDPQLARVETIDEYICAFPKPVQVLLTKLRAVIVRAAPRAEETIRYRMPAFTQGVVLVYFAAFKNHIGFFPGAAAIKAFTRDLQGYKLSKGTIQFPFDQPLPLALIAKVVKFRVKENQLKEDAKRSANEKRRAKKG